VRVDPVEMLDLQDEYRLETIYGLLLGYLIIRLKTLRDVDLGQLWKLREGSYCIQQQGVGCFAQVGLSRMTQ